MEAVEDVEPVISSAFPSWIIFLSALSSFFSFSSHSFYATPGNTLPNQIKKMNIPSSKSSVNLIRKLHISLPPQLLRFFFSNSKIPSPIQRLPCLINLRWWITCIRRWFRYHTFDAVRIERGWAAELDGHYWGLRYAWFFVSYFVLISYFVSQFKRKRRG